MGWLLVAALALLPARAALAADPGFDRIVGDVGRQSRDRSCARMAAWIDAHPRDPNAGRGLIWMAELRLADRRTDLAGPLFARAARDYQGTEWGLHGIKGTADLDLLDHHYALAIAAYERLAALPSPYWSYVGRMAAHDARAERIRFAFYVALIAGLLLLAAGRAWLAARTAGKGLWPAPEEVTYALPVTALLLIAAPAQQADEAHAVIAVALGGIALLWANGAYLRARPPQRARRLLEAALGIAQAGALLYCAVVASGLWAKFAETLAAGADR